MDDKSLMNNETKALFSKDQVQDTLIKDKDSQESSKVKTDESNSAQAKKISSSTYENTVANDDSSDTTTTDSEDAQSLIDLANEQDVLTLSQEELNRLDRRPLNIDGFRLERVDVYNWGSFNNNVKSVYFGGQNVLMTGDNGAGKSSIIDAITVLLYDVKKITFNQAAGAEKGERNLASYVLGLYKNDNSSGVKTELGLRSKDDAVLTIIMASFYNKKLNEHVVLIQCMVMMKQKNAPARYYFIANRDFNLQQDVLPVKDIRELGVKFRKLGITRYEQFGEYYSQMQRLFGIENTKVLDLFYKTISMKSISNISDFVRKQMLEDFNGDELVEQLVERFNDLDASYKSVEEAKKQVEALEPICQKGEEYKDTQTRIEFLNKCETGVSPYLYKKKADFLKVEIDKGEKRIADLNKQSKDTFDELQDIEDKIIAVKTDLERQGGHRLESLNQQLIQYQSQYRSVLDNYKMFEFYTNQLNIEPVDTTKKFDELKVRLDKMHDDLSRQSESYDSDNAKHAVEQSDLEKRIRSLKNEIDSLNARKSNIPADYVNLRNNIANAIGCNQEDLPFAGELMQVKSEEKLKWESAIEKVLHGFAISMLVPEQHYKAVTEYVNHNNLKMRLVFFRIKENDFNNKNTINTSLGAQIGHQLNNFSRHSYNQTLPSKIDIKNDPVFHGYIKNSLERGYNYVCTEDLEEYRKERMALTPTGMHKSGGRNEKDDRRRTQVNEYVLGWTNKEKILFLKQEYSENVKKLTTVESAISSLREAKIQTNNKITAISKLQVYKAFDKIDHKSIKVLIDKTSKEIDELKLTNNVVATLQKNLDHYNQQRAILNDRNNSFSREIGQLQSLISSNKKEYQNALDLCESLKYITASVVSAIEKLIDNAINRLRYSELKYEYIDIVMSEVQNNLKHELAKLKSKESSMGQDLVNMQSRFCQTFVVAARNLDASRAAAWEDFKVFLDKLMTDDLPRFVEAFKDKLNRETIDQLGTLNASLIAQCRKIKDRIADINVIMKDVDFNVDRYIQMQARENPDVEIKQFRYDLRNCTSTSNEDGSLENAETRFYQVKALIDRFKGEVNGADIDMRWRNKVTDVKQWFDFAASEHSRIDDSQTDYYEDSGGKSGGQKEKLAYTVLASSIAYQYRSKARQKGGLSVNNALNQGMSVDEAVTLQKDDGALSYNYADRSYRFVVIDEAFGRGSPQSVDYALTLFSKFNLQLLIATPMQKLDIIEKYVNHVAFVYRDEDTHESTVVNYELEDYIIKRKLKEQIAKAPFMSAIAKQNGDAISSLSAEQASEYYHKLDERILKEQGKFSGPKVSDNISPEAKEIIKNSASKSKKSSHDLDDQAKNSNIKNSAKSTKAASDSSLGSLFNDDDLESFNNSDTKKSDNSKGELLKFKDAQGNYLDAQAYVNKIQEQRKVTQLKRTEEALSKLDFLESLHQDNTKDEVEVVTIVSDDITDYSANDDKTSDNKSTKDSKKTKVDDEEPVYAHSLDDLVIFEDEEP